jgi:hypothetical protein
MGHSDLTVIDARSMKLDEVLQGSAAGLSAPTRLSSDGKEVWVDDHAAVTELDARTGRTLRVIAASRDRVADPVDISSDDRNVWVAGYLEQTVTELQARDGGFVQAIR